MLSSAAVGELNTWRLRLALCCLVITSLCACPGNFVKANRPTPVCAVRDCSSGLIIDDGCSADGKCLSCANDCGGKVAPRNGPAR